ncbi:MAG: hypothetical protein GX601_16635, partial [Anaerolineales bacterium]|nr:hypothetical protein [Anaerolineales bacterium]
AGAVGIVRRSSDCLLAVGDWDSDSIDFYVSDGYDLLSAGCVFARVRTWSHSERDTSGWVDGNWGKYQALNLLQEPNGQLYLVGFHRHPPNTGQDWADLYRLDLDAPEPRMLVKIDKKGVACQGGASFQWAGGLVAPDPTREITLLAVEAHFREETIVNRF